LKGKYVARIHFVNNIAGHSRIDSGVLDGLQDAEDEDRFLYGSKDDVTMVSASTRPANTLNDEMGIHKIASDSRASAHHEPGLLEHGVVLQQRSKQVLKQQWEGLQQLHQDETDKQQLKHLQLARQMQPKGLQQQAQGLQQPRKELQQQQGLQQQTDIFKQKPGEGLERHQNFTQQQKKGSKQGIGLQQLREELQQQGLPQQQIDNLVRQWLIQKASCSEVDSQQSKLATQQINQFQNHSSHQPSNIVHKGSSGSLESSDWTPLHPKASELSLKQFLYNSSRDPRVASHSVVSAAESQPPAERILPLELQTSSINRDPVNLTISMEQRTTTESMIGSDRDAAMAKFLRERIKVEDDKQKTGPKAVTHGKVVPDSVELELENAINENIKRDKLRVEMNRKDRAARKEERKKVDNEAAAAEAPPVSRKILEKLEMLRQQQEKRVIEARLNAVKTARAVEKEMEEEVFADFRQEYMSLAKHDATIETASHVNPVPNKIENPEIFIRPDLSNAGVPHAISGSAAHPIISTQSRLSPFPTPSAVPSSAIDSQTFSVSTHSILSPFQANVPSKSFMTPNVTEMTVSSQIFAAIPPAFAVGASHIDVVTQNMYNVNVAGNEAVIHSVPEQSSAVVGANVYTTKAPPPLVLQPTALFMPHAVEDDEMCISPGTPLEEESSTLETMPTIVTMDSPYGSLPPPIVCQPPPMDYQPPQTVCQPHPNMLPYSGLPPFNLPPPTHFFPYGMPPPYNLPHPYGMYPPQIHPNYNMLPPYQPPSAYPSSTAFPMPLHHPSMIPQTASNSNNSLAGPPGDPIQDTEWDRNTENFLRRLSQPDQPQESVCVSPVSNVTANERLQGLAMQPNSNEMAQARKYSKDQELDREHASRDRMMQDNVSGNRLSREGGSVERGQSDMGSRNRVPARHDYMRNEAPNYRGRRDDVERYRGSSPPRGNSSRYRESFSPEMSFRGNGRYHEEKTSSGRNSNHRENDLHDDSNRRNRPSENRARRSPERNAGERNERGSRSYREEEGSHFRRLDGRDRDERYGHRSSYGDDRDSQQEKYRDRGGHSLEKSFTKEIQRKNSTDRGGPRGGVSRSPERGSRKVERSCGSSSRSNTSNQPNSQKIGAKEQREPLPKNRDSDFSPRSTSRESSLDKSKLPINRRSTSNNDRSNSVVNGDKLVEQQQSEKRGTDSPHRRPLEQPDRSVELQEKRIITTSVADDKRHVDGNLGKDASLRRDPSNGPASDSTPSKHPGGDVLSKMTQNDSAPSGVDNRQQSVEMVSIAMNREEIWSNICLLEKGI